MLFREYNPGDPVLIKNLFKGLLNTKTLHNNLMIQYFQIMEVITAPNSTVCHTHHMISSLYTPLKSHSCRSVCGLAFKTLMDWVPLHISIKVEPNSVWFCCSLKFYICLTINLHHSSVQCTWWCTGTLDMVWIEQQQQLRKAMTLFFSKKKTEITLYLIKIDKNIRDGASHLIFNF